MKTLLLTTLALSFFVATGTVSAVPPGMEVTWETPIGAVPLSGQTHADAGTQCEDCHTDTFEQKNGAAEMTMAEMNEGKWCGKCHNGDQAFGTADPNHCMTCHKPPE